MTEPPAAPLFANSRRLTGANRHFTGPAAELEALPPAAFDPQAIARWQDAARDLCRGLGWPPAQLSCHRHAGGTILALAARYEHLEIACDINEVSWIAAALGESLAIERLLPQLRRDAAYERWPGLGPLLAAAQDQALPVLVDDRQFSVGYGAGGQSWPLDALPDAALVPWDRLATCPVLLVTGTNGKTTSVRLCAAFAATAGQTVGYNCTDGVFIGGSLIEEDDFAGPDGARMVLRHPRVTFAVLEVARGGILRRGLAVDRARAAIVTNITADHFGEYGVDSLDDLADAKLTVARVVEADGLLVLNADDPILLARAARQTCPVGLFAADFDHPALISHRAAGGASCGVAAGRLRVSRQGADNDLGAVADMPLTASGSAHHNIANIAAAALASAACGIGTDIIAAVLARFGSERADNPGRLEGWTVFGYQVLLDYAHNPDGMTALLAVAKTRRRPGGRLGLVMGQAGNRSDREIAQLARSAAAGRPDLVVLKDEPGMLRGRAVGEVPALLRQALIDAELAPAAILMLEDEFDAACGLLSWARPGDVVVLSVHGRDSRPRLRAMLDRLEGVR